VYERQGTLIPKIFFESDIATRIPDPVWAQVAKNGYAELPDISIPQNLADQSINESFIPYGMNEDLNMAKSILHPYFASQANYDPPELHQNPNYMSEMTELMIKQIPTMPLIMEQAILHTADIVKYIYDKNDANSKVGPYRFHMDFVPRNLFMFFVYFSKVQPIIGRELLVGQRNDFSNFSKETLYPQAGSDTPDVFRSIEDDEVTHFKSLKVQNNSVLLMNTMNPMFVHRVNKLRHSNEVVLLTHYLWSK
jgi:hypothetical protein